LPIRFGSDGWRGIIGHEFTLDNVARIAAAVCEWWPEQDDCAISVGFENREMSQDAALHVCRIFRLLKPGVTVFLSSNACPSPYISWATHYYRNPIGIQITASHNPPHYNGVKLKGIHGGSLLPKDVVEIENLANCIEVAELVLPQAQPEDASDELE